MRLSDDRLVLGRWRFFPIEPPRPKISRASTAPQQQLLDAGQLDQLVAPIALYPDPLLAQVLMASTYPLEVVQADRLAKANKWLKGDKLTEALDKQDWDASVKQLVSTPTVLAMMNDKLDWTQAAWRRRACPTGRRDGRHSASARQGASQRQARDDQAAEGDGQAGRRAVHRSSRSSRRRLTSSTCPTTNRPWSTAIGHIRIIRLTTFRRRRAGSSAARSPPGSPGARPTPSAVRSGTISTGITAISISTSIAT